ncbi:MAG: hypothetical protein ABSF48_25650 [Thermodesulfobacteriota bacterium]
MSGEAFPLGPYIIEKMGKKGYFFTHDYECEWSGTRHSYRRERAV